MKLIEKPSPYELKKIINNQGDLDIYALTKKNIARFK